MNYLKYITIGIFICCSNINAGEILPYNQEQSFERDFSTISEYKENLNTLRNVQNHLNSQGKFTMEALPPLPATFTKLENMKTHFQHTEIAESFSKAIEKIKLWRIHETIADDNGYPVLTNLQMYAFKQVINYLDSKSEQNDRLKSYFSIMKEINNYIIPIKIKRTSAFVDEIFDAEINMSEKMENLKSFQELEKNLAKIFPAEAHGIQIGQFGERPNFLFCAEDNFEKLNALQTYLETEKLLPSTFSDFAAAIAKIKIWASRISLSEYWVCPPQNNQYGPILADQEMKALEKAIFSYEKFLRESNK